MAVTLTQGTIEYLIVEVTDELHTLADLTGTAPKFTVLDTNGVIKVNEANGTPVGMKVYCLVDTTAGGLWTGGNYRLYLRLTTAPEVPRLGPFAFTVDAT